MIRLVRLLAALTLALALPACQLASLSPLPATATVRPAEEQALFAGRLVLAEAYAPQANPAAVRANATVTLVDPATGAAKGTGITAPDGTFTVQALGTFTPALGGLYLLESSKALGGAGTPVFRLRTLVQFTAAGWTSVTGATIQLSTMTTAVGLLWDHLGLSAGDVIGKVILEAATGTHRAAALGPGIQEADVQRVETLVQEALLRGMDPVQFVRPAPGGAWRLGLGDRSRNLLVDPGFEDQATRDWFFNNPAGVASFSREVGAAYEGQRALRLDVTGAGDLWYGQGYAGGAMTSRGIPLVGGKTYTYSIYARANAAGRRLQLQVNPQTGDSTRYNSPSFVLTTAWQRYAYSFTASTSTPAAIALIRPGSVAGEALYPTTVHLDAAQLEEGGGATGYAPPGRMTIEGFANPEERSGTSVASGRVGTGVVVDLGVNLAPNSSFEVDGDADGVPDGMSLAGANGGQFALDADVYRFGSRSLRITKGAPTGDYVGTVVNHTFQAGRTYTFSVWMKGQGVSGAANSDCGIYVDCLLPDGALSGLDVFTAAGPVGTFGWTRVSVTHTFVKTCTVAKFNPMFRNKTGTVWFDGLQVEEADYPTPYAGEGTGPDTLAFDANRHVERTQGTIAFWYRPAYHWGERPSMIFGLTRADSGDDVCNLDTFRAADGTPQLRFQLHDGVDWNVTTYRPTSSVPWRVDTWHHLATTWGPRGMELYLDGERIATHPYAGPIFRLPLGRLLFSGAMSNFTVCAQGTLDGLQVWDVQQGPEWVRRDALGLTQ